MGKSKLVVLFVLGLLGFIVLIYGTFFLSKDLDRRSQEIDRKTFESSPSYVHGKAQEIAKMRFELLESKDEVARLALKRRILEVAATVDTTKFTLEMQTYLRDLQN